MSARSSRPQGERRIFHLPTVPPGLAFLLGYDVSDPTLNVRAPYALVRDGHLGTRLVICELNRQQLQDFYEAIGEELHRALGHRPH